MTDAEIAAKHGDAFRRCLIEGDVAGVMQLFKHVAPHLPQPGNRLEGEITLHLARTAARSIPLRLRKFSDRWLRERRIGTFLPHEHQLHPGERR
jgi:hypothetical protein